MTRAAIGTFGSARSARTTGAVPLWFSSILGIYALAMYGVAHYAIGTAAPAMAKEFGVSTSTIFAAFSAALLLNAALAPSIGRLIDRVGAGRILLAGAIGRALAVLALAFAIDIYMLLAAILAIQSLSQLSEYDATFAAVVEVGGKEARSAVSVITLWGGLASTAFWPLTAWLLESEGWRNLFIVYAVLLAVLCVPIASVVLAGAGRCNGASAVPGDATEPLALPGGPRVESTTGSHHYLPLTIAFALGTVALGLPVMLLPVLEGLGLGAGAVLAGIVFGPAQTAGRFFELAFGQRLRPIIVAVIATGLLPISLLLLLLGGGSAATAVAFAMMFGAAAGVSHVVRGTVMLSLSGPNAYAASLGRVATARLVAGALTPIALARVLDHFGAAAVIATCAATATAAALVFWHVARTTDASSNIQPSERIAP